MTKRLAKEGLIHEGVEAMDLRLGAYSYTGPFCFLQNAVVKKFANIAASVRIGNGAVVVGVPARLIKYRFPEAFVLRYGEGSRP